MSLWSEKIPKKNKTKTLLLRVHNCLNVSLKNPFRKISCFSENSPKETSFFISAGITVEAAAALTVFIVFCAGLLSLFNMLGRQVVSNYGLETQNEREAMLAEILPEYDSDIFSYEAYEDSYLFMPSYMTDTQFFFTAVRRAWTGRVLDSGSSEDADEACVYVADYGRVYHMTEECTHLRLSISQTSFSSLSYLRNNNGAIYKPCEKCCGDQTPETVLITKEGDRYHCSSGCSGLKRTYKRVPLSECSLPPCSRCAGSGYD